MKFSFNRIYNVRLREMLVVLLIKLSSSHNSTEGYKIQRLYACSIEDYTAVKKHIVDANLCAPQDRAGLESTQ